MPSADAALVPFATRSPSRRVAEPVACKRIAFAAVLASVRDLPLDEAGYPIIPIDRIPALTQALRAFEGADERARIARGRPLPGSLRPERKTTRKPRASVAPIVRVSAPAPEPSPASTDAK